MTKNPLILLVLCSILILSCSKGDWLRDPEGLEAEIVLIGGSCGGVKVVKIDRRFTRKSVPQNSCVPQQAETRRETDAAVFKELTRFVEILDLHRNPIEECWRCVDGADYMITLRNGSNRIEHTIALNTDNKGRQEFITFLNSL
ncbi:hypothetical protein M8998_10625 [Sphingobacterium sp. lm-10]|uniref:hypothetical protein n=1 Tax=Sphingobacterium sp. lm-10 TaxID=2944904 RepID=UPI002020E6D2|nr:hypothetical protein [Sphingobacterium sp. lm-10]MCL7988393.1 hypothetical protein [Sphingobacterium sp. lm-10]